LNKLTIRNFKLFDEVGIELAERVVFVGPNNAGKTSVLQALALWNAGVRRWVENAWWVDEVARVTGLGYLTSTVPGPRCSGVRLRRFCDTERRNRWDSGVLERRRIVAEAASCATIR